MKHLLNILKGVVIGIANAIPGVSGGTMMVIMNVFDKLLGCVTLKVKVIKENLAFLITIFLGAGIGVLLSAKVLDVLFESEFASVPTQFFFMGVVIGSLPMIFREVTAKSKFKPINIIPLIIGTGLIVGVTLLTNVAGENEVAKELSPSMFVYLLLVAAVSAAAMLMPGLSGSLVMLILGAYETVITAVGELNILMLIPVALGVVIGLVVCAKLITICLKKFYQGTYCLILGLIVGSLYAIYPVGEFSLQGEKLTQGLVSIGVLVVGIAIPLLMEMISKKYKAKDEIDMENTENLD